MEKHLQFGVGCFHFTTKRKTPFTFSVKEYVKDVEEYLKAIPNVSNININSQDLKEVSFEVDEETPSIEYETFPHINFLEISFEIFIPFRIQEQIESRIPFGGLTTEKFLVHITDTFYMPTTFVQPIDPADDDDASSAVILIREFLEEQDEKVHSSNIKFQFLGPSPFHSDFFIHSQEEAKEYSSPIQLEIQPLSGYDRINFYYDVKKFSSIEEARDFIYDEIKTELGFFYNVVQTRVSRWFVWREIEEDYKKIVEAQKRGGVKGFVLKYFSPGHLNKTVIRLVEFESNDLFAQQSVRNDFKQLYHGATIQVAQRNIQEELDDIIEFPVRQLLELLQLFGSQREKSTELLVAIFSAIIGGIAGSVLTILLASKP